MGDDSTITDGVDRIVENSRQPRQTTATDATPDIAIDEVFDVLTDPRRRTVLAILRETADGTASVPVLATTLSTHSEVTATRGQTAGQLHHTILPKLAEDELIEHDRQAGTIQYIGHPWVEAALDLAAQWEDDREH